jgi:hypothetical protein
VDVRGSSVACAVDAQQQEWDWVDMADILRCSKNLKKQNGHPDSDLSIN